MAQFSPACVSVLRDLRYSVRGLTRTPGLTAMLLLTVALGIGSNTVVYGFVRGLTSASSTPEGAEGVSRIEPVLYAAAIAVFLIACANVACLLLSRASSRARETSLRVAIGARRGQLVRQLLSDSVLIALAGGALGLVLATWTISVVPSLFFDRDAAQLVFAPSLAGTVIAPVICIAIMIACGLAPLLVVRDDRPAAVLQREIAGPSPAMRRVRMALVVMQMSFCCMLIVGTGLLLDHFDRALRTDVGRRGGHPILATAEARPGISRYETTASGLAFFHAVENAARDVTGGMPRAWVSRLPGSLPTWQQFRVESPHSPVHDEHLNVTSLTPASIEDITLPPLTGRLFGAQDTAEGCRVVIVNDTAANQIFAGDAVGRAIEDPAGQSVQVVGVVATRRPDHVVGPIPPTVYYYAEQTDLPTAQAGPASFLVPTRSPSSPVTLDSNVVSADYFEAMGWMMDRGTVFADARTGGCRVGIVNREAEETYFGGNAVGAAVIDHAGRRTDIIGVVHAAPLLTLQRRVESAIYFPMTQDFLPGMTLILDAPSTSDAQLERLQQRLEAVPGRGPAPVVVRTLDSHLRATALAPLRIATTLVGASTATALALCVLGLGAAMIDSVHHRRREIAVRAALGAPAWRVIRQVTSEGVRLAGTGAVVGLLGSLLISRTLAQVAPSDAAAPMWIWLIAPIVLLAAVVVAGLLPIHRALKVAPIAITRADF